jgi:CubicO group peptidase (beta-lactamase class C family)
MSSNRRETLIGMSALGAGTLLGTRPALAAEAEIPFAGTYAGVLEIGGVRLRLKLDVSADHKAALTSLDQGNIVIPTDRIQMDGKTIVITFLTIGADYKAVLGRAGELTGTFTQSGQSAPLTLARRGAGVPEVAPPPPAPKISGPLTLEKLRAHRLALGTPAMGAGWQRSLGQTTIITDGLRSAQSMAPVTNDDRWHLGSITKSMTATLVARLVEARRLNWYTTIGAVLGKKLRGIHPGFAAVTLLHLLSHRSGMPTNAGMGRLDRYAREITPGVREERLALAQEVLSVPPITAPGSAFAYANAGYIIAGAMCEVVTGKPWEVLIQKLLFDPLGLASAMIGPPDAGTQPMGHQIGADGKRTATSGDNPAVLGPAGRVSMNIADLLRYLAAHRDQSVQLLSPQAWAMLHTAPFGGAYALGWEKRGNAFFHGGSNTVWLAEAAFEPKLGLVTAFVSNDTAAMRTNSAVLKAAAEAALQ